MAETVGRLCSVLGTSVPLISAPMAGIAGGALAQAVSDAGAFGMIGGGYGDPAWLATELRKVRPETIGIGFIGWALEQRSIALELAIDANPRAIMLSFGGLRRFAPTITSAGIPLVVQVQTLADARIAVLEGAAMIVAQGTEAGGHCGSRSTLTLVPEVVDAVGEVPVVAAGGIGDGRGLAAALVLGAAGALCGSAFYVAEESLSTVEAKTLLTNATGDETVRSDLYDIAREIDWPRQWQTRSLRNAYTDKWHGSTDNDPVSHSNIKREYATAIQSADQSKLAVFAGESVGLIHRKRTASQIVEEITRCANEKLCLTKFAN